MSTTTTVPGLVAGTWTIDPVHSEVAFTVRHLMVSKVRGIFRTFEGSVTVADDLTASAVQATIDAGSISTNDDNRDNHLRSGDFFGAESNPKLTFVSTSVAPKGGDWAVTGDLTIKGITKSVVLDLEFNGVGPDPRGGQRAGFSASTEISRSDFGVDLQIPLDGGGVVIGEKVRISLEIEAVQAQS